LWRYFVIVTNHLLILNSHFISLKIGPSLSQFKSLRKLHCITKGIRIIIITTTTTTTNTTTTITTITAIISNTITDIQVVDTTIVESMYC
jgi:hypothetical protein